MLNKCMYNNYISKIIPLYISFSKICCSLQTMTSYNDMCCWPIKYLYHDEFGIESESRRHRNAEYQYKALNVKDLISRVAMTSNFYLTTDAGHVEETMRCLEEYISKVITTRQLASKVLGRYIQYVHVSILNIRMLSE